MKPTQALQDITLMHSQCSDSLGQGHSDIFRAVTKSLKSQLCDQHQQKYQFYREQRLMCPDCFTEHLEDLGESLSGQIKKKYEYFCSLENILNHPIILTIEQSQFLSYPLELMQLSLTSYKQLYQKKADFKVQKQMINSFIQRTKSRINQLCTNILDSYSQVEENMTRHSELKDNMKGLNTMYEQQMMEMLGQKFTQGSKTELQTIFQQYSSRNENPFETMMTHLHELMGQVESTPFIDTQKLQQIYSTITDEHLWKTSQIILTLPQLKDKKYETADLIINDQNINLQGQYQLRCQEQQLSLIMGGQLIGNLQVHIDSLYELPGYKLIGVNYDKLFVISYFDQLKVEDQIFISGCTDILPFPYHIIAISNNNLIKISLQTKEYQVLGKNYKNLKYHDKKSLNFSCQNERDQVVTWNAFTQFIIPIVS